MQLENMPPKIVNEIDTNIVFKQYEILVSEASRISKSRENTNAFFSTIVVALFTATFSCITQKIYSYILIFALCTIWYIIINSYKELNRAKFQVIQEIEQLFPFQPFKKEQDYYKQNILSFSKIEKYIPIIFGLPSLCIVIIEVLKCLMFFIKSF